jgi:RNA polymerase sigma factor (sigma-70 family)
MCLVSEGETWKGVSVLSPPIAGSDRQDRFQAIYQGCHAAVLGYVVRRTASPDDAADVMAETFLTCWRRLEEVPPGPEARLWLFGVARRTLANHHRGERRRLALADRLRDDLVTAYRPPQHTAEESRITAAFLRLPADQRELLALNAWEGLDYGEIAVVLSCSRNTVRVRMYRARKRMASELASVPAPALRGSLAQTGDRA